jgi:hypothetical protein
MRSIQSCLFSYHWPRQQQGDKRCFGGAPAGYFVREHEKQQRKKQMNDIVCGCSVCDGPIYESQLDGETVDENRVYKCGELQYIELFHATCAYEYARRCQIEFQESLGEESLWE